MSTHPSPESTCPPRLNLAHLPSQPLYSSTDPASATPEGLGWQLSPEPFKLSIAQHQQLLALGEILNRFVQAIDHLYRASKNPNLPVPGWVADLYDQGKPDTLLQFAAMKRLKSHLPLVLRPDLLLRDDGWTLCEIDAVPGGLGFTAALNQLYRKSGFPVIEATEGGLPGAFLEMLKAFAPEVENPTIAIVLSDEADDYRAEMSWLVDTIRQGSEGAAPYPNIHLVHPKHIELVRDRLVFTDPESAPDNNPERPIDLIYRFFELFDLPNVPKIELIQYAIKKGLVKCTPPLKPQVEEKLSLALLHHPILADFWQKELGAEAFAQLKQWVPAGWMVDPAPLPPQAVIANLAPGGKPVQDFRQLKALSQKERELVLKPSGFSELAWGSRGVTIGHDHSAESWGERLDVALASYGKTPYILQEFIPAGTQTVERLNLSTGEVTPFKARTRLCPYYFIQNGMVTLAGVLATACPADKKLIHGMKDAVLAPCQVAG